MQEEGKGQHEAYLVILARNSSQQSLEMHPNATETTQKKKYLMAQLKESNPVLWQDLQTSLRQCGRSPLDKEFVSAILRGEKNVSV
jgi:hypothetical protein